MSILEFVHLTLILILLKYIVWWILSKMSEMDGVFFIRVVCKLQVYKGDDEGLKRRIIHVYEWSLSVKGVDRTWWWFLGSLTQL